MSKFIDKLNKLSKGESQGMGFTSRQAAAPKSKIQLIASLDAGNAESLAGHLAGADIVMLGISKSNSGAAAVEKLSKSLPDAIRGARLRDGSPVDLEKLAKAGFDFVVFSANRTQASTLKGDKEIGKIIELEASLSDGLLRAANELPVDAYLVDGELKENQVLTWGQMMIFSRFAGLNKPLIVPASAQVTIIELEALWEAGINAVVIEIDAKQPQDLMMKLRQEIDKTEFESRRAKRAEATISRTSTPGRPSRKDEEDE